MPVFKQHKRDKKYEGDDVNGAFEAIKRKAALYQGPPVLSRQIGEHPLGMHAKCAVEGVVNVFARVIQAADITKDKRASLAVALNDKAGRDMKGNRSVNQFIAIMLNAMIEVEETYDRTLEPYKTEAERTAAAELKFRI